MTTPATINLLNSPVQGQLNLDAAAVENIALPDSTSNLSLPLPTGISEATFVTITAVTCTDLTIKTAVGGTSLSVPYRRTVVLYGITELYLTSALGGQVQVVIG